MRSALPILSLLIWLTATARALGQTEPLVGTLKWNNGDRLQGRLVAIGDGHIQWASPRFRESQHIHTDYIDSVEFDHARAGEVTEPFRVELSTGDVVFGKLVGLSNDLVTIDSQRVGLIRIKRDFVREIRQLQHTEVLYDGPRWLDGWKVLKAGRRLSEWTATEHGHLQTEKYGAEIFHDLPQLEIAEMNLVLRWTGKPGFQVDFSAPGELVSSRPKPKLSIKSWGNDVVAQSSLDAADFQHLLKLTDRQKELRLRLVWNNTTGQININGDGGRKLGTVIIDKTSSSPGFGILIKNRSDDLIVEQIRISKWNGSGHTQDRKSGESYLRLADGDLVVGDVVGLEGDSLRTSGAVEFVPLEKLAVAEFIPLGSAEPQSAHLRFLDGTELAGEILHVDGTVASLHSPIAEDAVQVVLADLESLRFFQGKTSEYDFHLEFDDGQRLSGNLAPADGTAELGWRSVGSRNAVSLVDAQSASIERRMSAQFEDGARQGNEIVYFRDGSIAIGSIDAIDQEYLSVQTPYSQPTRVALSDVRAVEILQASGRVSFASQAWEFVGDQRPIQRAHERIEVADPVGFRDLKLFHGGKLSFSCAWSEDFVGLMTIYLGTSTTLPRGGVVRFTFSRERMMARCLLKPTSSQTLPPMPDRRATVSLETEGDQLKVWVNGMLAIDTQLRTDIAKQGIWLQCGSARGPLSRNANGQPKQARLAIERLRVGDNANRLGASFASSDQLDMLLKLPRNRRQDAPACILCSTNGDLLRGHLLAVDQHDVHFRSRFEEITMPRGDVAAIVWLQPLGEPKALESDLPPSPEAQNTSPQSPLPPDETASRERPSAGSDGDTETARSKTRVTLRDGSVYLFDSIGMQASAIFGDHASLKTCHVPIDLILKVQFGGRRLGASIASLLNWQLEATPEPKFAAATGEGGIDSPLIGQDVQDVVIPILDGTDFRIGDHREQVVVLDFWATWCAPCIRSLPKLIATVGNFSQDTVKLVAVNQEETPFTVKTFQLSRGLDMDVGMDPNADLARRFGVEAIPHTVVIGPDGRVGRVFVGAPTDLHLGIERAISELLPPTD